MTSRITSKSDQDLRIRILSLLHQITIHIPDPGDEPGMKHVMYGLETLCKGLPIAKFIDYPSWTLFVLGEDDDETEALSDAWQDSTEKLHIDQFWDELEGIRDAIGVERFAHVSGHQVRSRVPYHWR